MGRDSLLKGTEEKEKKAAKKSKEGTSKKKKRATPSKKETKASTKAKKSKPKKTTKTTRKTVKKVEKSKEIKTSQEVPETTPVIEEKETKAPPAQTTDVVEETAGQPTKEPETEKEVEKSKEIKTSQKVPETTPVIEEKETKAPPAQTTDVVEETAGQPIKEPETEKEPVREPESSQESVVVKSECTMSNTQEPEKSAIWIYGASAALLLLLVLLTASFINSNIFSFKQKGNTVELWKGYFAPMGMGPVRTFSDLQLPTDEEGKTIIQDTYTKEEAYGILFQHFLSKADEALSRQETPDLKEINAFLGEAEKYALTDNAKKTVRLRKNGLRFLVLMGKVNLALARDTEEDLIAAKQYLAEIDQIATTPIQRQMLRQKTAAIESALKKISAEKKE